MPLITHSLVLESFVSAIHGALRFFVKSDNQPDPVIYFASEMGRKSKNPDFRKSKQTNKFLISDKILTEEIAEQADLKPKDSLISLLPTNSSSQTDLTFSSTNRVLRVRTGQGKVQKLSNGLAKFVCPWVSTKTKAPKGFQHKIVSSSFGPRRVLFNTTIEPSPEDGKNPALENFQKTVLTPIVEEDESGTAESSNSAAIST